MLWSAANWLRRRQHFHDTAIALAALQSIRAARPDHIAFTGDLLNISAWEEFPRGRDWIAQLGAPDEVTFVPGNHDAYVRVPFNEGLAHFLPWMSPDGVKDGALQFPFVRLRRNVALVGLCSALPQALHKAGGTLGTHQLRDLSHLLQSLRDQGFYRVIMIHHPPLPGLASTRKALTDAAELQDVLDKEGCELVLHGHNHRTMTNWFETRSGPAPAIGVASASGAPIDDHEAAGWNLFRIRRQHGRWQTELTRHQWSAQKRGFVAARPALLSPP
jgi:3',5'-cyclic AMP phosphodiesterase CpdA